MAAKPKFLPRDFCPSGNVYRGFLTPSFSDYAKTDSPYAIFYHFELLLCLLFAIDSGVSVASGLVWALLGYYHGIFLDELISIYLAAAIVFSGHERIQRMFTSCLPEVQGVAAYCRTLLKFLQLLFLP